MGQGIKLSEIIEKMNLKNLTPEVDMVEKEVNVRMSTVRRCSLRDFTTALIQIVYRSSEMWNTDMYRH